MNNYGKLMLPQLYVVARTKRPADTMCQINLYIQVNFIFEVEDAVRPCVSRIYPLVRWIARGRCLFKSAKQDPLDKEQMKKLRENNDEITREIEVRICMSCMQHA